MLDDDDDDDADAEVFTGLKTSSLANCTVH